MVGTMQLDKLAKFYEQVFGKAPNMSEEKYKGWLVGSTFFNLGEHSEVKGKSKEPARVIFNLETKEVKEEFTRISKISGATVIKEPYKIEGWDEGWIATFADPDGNYFQLMSPWENPNNSN